MSPRVTSALVLCGVFLLGGLTGAGLERARSARRQQEMFEAPPPNFRQRQILRGLDRAVDLDDGQRERVRAILERYAGEAQEARREVGPKLHDLRGRMEEDLRKEMRPEQLPQFDRFMDRVKARDERPKKR
uniref:Periplasmic heavy metal sensor n=1 Tax=Jahnella sp. MSr9139 TaxID=1434086 RepID=A0A4Y5SZS5_9BACT|nr:hypothetical protein [Jahnella sp. MSr9139]